MEMSEISEELYESYPAMSAKYHADMIEEYVQKRLKSSQARLSEAVKVLEWVNAELKDHGYAEIGTLRATVINAIEAAKS